MRTLIKLSLVLFSHLMPWHLVSANNVGKFFGKFDRCCVTSRLPRPLLPRRLLLPRRRLLLRLLVVTVVVAAVVRPLLPLLGRALLSAPLLTAALVVALEFCFALLGRLAPPCKENEVW